MAFILYSLVLFLMIFGAAMTMINESGLYSQKMPESGISTTLVDAESTAAGFQDTSKNPAFSAIDALFLGGKIVLGAFLSVFTLGFILQGFGIDLGIVTFLISPLPIVFVFAVIEYFTGRSAE